jgi:chaperone modulatory protein CbpM
MINQRDLTVLSGQLLEDDLEMTLGDICKACGISAEQLLEMVNEGIIEPLDKDTTLWRFKGVSLKRIHCAVNLHRELGVNWAGAALAVELIEELQALRLRLQRYEKD